MHLASRGKQIGCCYVKNGRREICSSDRWKIFKEHFDQLLRHFSFIIRFITVWIFSIVFYASLGFWKRCQRNGNQQNEHIDRNCAKTDKAKGSSKHCTLCSQNNGLKSMQIFQRFSKIFRVKVRQSRNYFFKPTFLPKNERTNSTLLQSGIYRWRIILADTDFFQQSVSANDFRDRNNRPSAKHFFYQTFDEL